LHPDDANRLGKFFSSRDILCDVIRRRNEEIGESAQPEPGHDHESGKRLASPQFPVRLRLA